jgi:Transglycosylase-like domain
MKPNRSLALLGAAGVFAGPTALAIAAEPEDGDVTTARLRAPLAGEPTARASMREHAHDRLLRRHERLTEKLGREQPREAHVWSNGRLREEIADLRAEQRRRRKPAGAAVSVAGGGAPSAHLQQIAACESGGDPRAIGGGGAFRGKYQFTYQTWQAVGGSGDPAAAPEAEQDARAAKLLASGGAGHWPVCG